MFVLGASNGSILGDVEVYLEGNAMIKDMLPKVEGFSLAEQFITMLMVVISMKATIPPLMFILKLRGEEKRKRTEHLLARAVSRTKIMGSFFGISIVAGFVMQLMAVLGMWSAGTAVMDDPIAFRTVFKAAMAYLPAMWIMSGLAVVLIGFLPQRTSLTWLYLGYSFFVVYLGGMLQFPEWMAKLSPFGNVPKIPVEDMDFTKMFVLTVIAIIMMFLGAKGYNRRDIQG